ncbi:hypothetical protein CASFOL_033063 [Castilleja foliolosa]|uniref:Uncharacterized protein n=1 Tax=Castilleja foliolosa TaxID=1961234 RepID=A0ABD3C3W5_9LAMI
METKPEIDPYTCPSFSSYSSNRLSEIAVRVAAGISNEDEEDFEFALFRHDSEVLIDDAQIGTVFPVFDLDLLQNRGGDGELSGESKQLDPSVTVPLSKLFLEDGDNNSCSSSEADELENIPAGWYCVWQPKAIDQPIQPPASECKKSKSTGSASKKWKFCEFLRSNSEGGKDNLVFLTPKNRYEKSPAKVKGKRAAMAVAPSAHEALYVRKRSIMEGNKKKSYLPYRRDLIGFFGWSSGFQQF